MPNTQAKPLTAEEKANGRTMLIGLAVATVGTWVVGRFFLGPMLIPIFVRTIPWWMHAVVFVLLFIGTVGTILGNTDKKKARKEYENSLGDLKRDPNNPDLREKTLQLGRRYSELMRDTQGRTLFDEVALMNDIHAACARATVGLESVGKVQITNPAAVAGQSVTQEVERLGQLLIAGVITADEFERGKSLFLGAPPDKAAAAVDLLQKLDALRQQGVLTQSEFNAKKWEILSERLIPGRMQPANLQTPNHVQSAPAQPAVTIPCPNCTNALTIPTTAASGSRHTCPKCNQTVMVE